MHPDPLLVRCHAVVHLLFRNCQGWSSAEALTSIEPHRFGRYNPEPICNYSPSQIDVAIHVRLGDRDMRDKKPSEQYFDLLEDFMDTISARVSNSGPTLPMFHIFSETKTPCPSTKNGAFEEFSRWPVDLDQVN